VGPTFEFRLNTSLPYYAYQQTAADIVGPCATIVPTSTSTTTNTITSTSTNTPIFTYTFTSTFTITPTNTLTNTPTLTDTSTVTNTPTNTATNTVTSTATNTATITDTPLTNNGVVSTLAGSGTAGSANGTGPGAQFNTPNGVAVDSSGNVYVGDTRNNLIRKITPEGVVSTLAGQAGVYGSANGTGTAASFNLPDGVAVDSFGNVYIADTYNNLIRKITSGGVVSTLAGSFNFPNGVAVDSSGNVYVADTNNNLIQKITSGGVVSILAGQVGFYGSTNGTRIDASFNNPDGVAVDSSGNVYVADLVNDLIRKISQ